MYEDKLGLATGEGYYPYNYLAERFKLTKLDVDIDTIGKDCALGIRKTQRPISRLVLPAREE